MSAQYEDWEAVESPAWLAFHRQWWGPPGSAQLEAARKSRTLTIAQSEVYSELRILVDTRGAIYLRDEVLWMYERFLRAFDEELPGGAYLAAPGCGKSYALPRVR